MLNVGWEYLVAPTLHNGIEEDWLDDAKHCQPSMPLLFLEGLVAAKPNEQILNMERSSRGSEGKNIIDGSNISSPSIH